MERENRYQCCNVVFELIDIFYFFFGNDSRRSSRLRRIVDALPMTNLLRPYQYPPHKNALLHHDFRCSLALCDRIGCRRDLPSDGIGREQLERCDILDRGGDGCVRGGRISTYPYRFPKRKSRMPSYQATLPLADGLDLYGGPATDSEM